MDHFMEHGWSDQELVRQALSGQERAFEELVRRYQTTLLRFFLQRHSREEALDLLQETFLRAWQGLVRYQNRWAFSTWIFTIAYRQSSSYFRKKKGSFPIHLFDESFSIEQIANRPTEELDGKIENLWTLAKATLTEAQWSAMWLFYAEEKSIREIAYILRRSETGVKTLLFRGRQKLREKLPPDDDD